jgi:hypothetical protein
VRTTRLGDLSSPSVSAEIIIFLRRFGDENITRNITYRDQLSPVATSNNVARLIHTLSAYATNAHLTLAQLSVPEKTNETTAIPDLLDQLAQAGQTRRRRRHHRRYGMSGRYCRQDRQHKADFLLPLKGNQPTMEAEASSYFETAPLSELVSKTTVEKGHGGIETRLYTALERGRLDQGRQILSGPTAVRKHQDACSHSQSNRIRRPMHLRHAALHLLCTARHRTARLRRARPLGCRKHALVARRRVQRRSVALPRRQAQHRSEGWTPVGAIPVSGELSSPQRSETVSRHSVVEAWRPGVRAVVGCYCFRAS